MSLFEKIFTALFLLNALINLYLIIKDSIRRKEKIIQSFWDLGFFRMFFYIVPFPITRNILREIDEKRKKEALKKVKSRN
jgi:hypothetical protein